MCQSKVCIQEFWYFVRGLDIQVYNSTRGINLSNLRTTILHTQLLLQVAKHFK